MSKFNVILLIIVCNNDVSKKKFKTQKRIRTFRQPIDLINDTTNTNLDTWLIHKKTINLYIIFIVSIYISVVSPYVINLFQLKNI